MLRNKLAELIEESRANPVSSKTVLTSSHRCEREKECALRRLRTSFVRRNEDRKSRNDEEEEGIVIPEMLDIELGF